MHFVVIGRDGHDALQRRMAVREAHLSDADKLIQKGKLLYGAALLDEAGSMNGSIMFFDVESRAELDAILAEEPYVSSKVWEDIEIRACKVGPSFVASAR